MTARDIKLATPGASERKYPFVRLFLRKKIETPGAAGLHLDLGFYISIPTLYFLDLSSHISMPTSQFSYPSSCSSVRRSYILAPTSLIVHLDPYILSNSYISPLVLPTFPHPPPPPPPPPNHWAFACLRGTEIVCPPRNAPVVLDPASIQATYNAHEKHRDGGIGVSQRAGCRRGTGHTPFHDIDVRSLIGPAFHASRRTASTRTFLVRLMSVNGDGGLIRRSSRKHPATRRVRFS